MDENLLNDIIERLLNVTDGRTNKRYRLCESEIQQLCRYSTSIFLNQPILLELQPPIKVCGDIRGHYSDLLGIFDSCGSPAQTNYLFLGDYVDRGERGIETICLLLAYKIKYQDTFFLLRGNHESASIKHLYGFYDECKRRFSVHLWKTFCGCFNCLPVAAIIDEKIFCVHGGLSPHLKNFDQIRDIPRPVDVPDKGLMCDLLWSDPDKDFYGWRENDNGVSCTFGSDRLTKFLDTHDIDLICRAHQVVEGGYEFFTAQKLVTIFSAPNYCWEFDNYGAVMNVDATLTISFHILKPSDKSVNLGSGNKKSKPETSPKKLKSSSVSRSESMDNIQMTNGVQEPAQNAGGDIVLVLESLKKQVAIDRCAFVKKKMEENRQKLIAITNDMYSASKMRRNSTICEGDNHVDLLTKRQQDALCTLNGSKEENEFSDDEESHVSSAVLIGSSFGMKNLSRPVKLAEVSKIPPYTTWVFLDRNQRMTEDQSVVGRRRIYYDQIGGEALIASDSEEEVVDDEEDKKEFGNTEDFILKNAIQEVGLSVGVLDSLAQCFSRRPSDIKARYDILNGKNPVDSSEKADLMNEPRIEDIFCDKDLDAALDSFDNLFCRRCLVFDCRLHGCSQDLVFPAEKQLPWRPPDSEKVPCGSCCYQLIKSESVATGSCSMPDGFEDKAIASSGSGGHQTSRRKKATALLSGMRTKSNQSDTASSNAINISESSESEIRPQKDKLSTQQSSSPNNNVANTQGLHKRNNKRVAEHVLSCMQKIPKKLSTSDSDSIADGSPWTKDRKLRSSSRKDNEDAISSSQQKVMSPSKESGQKELPCQAQNGPLSVEVQDKPCQEMIKGSPVVGNDDTSRKDEFVDENMCKHEGDKSWNTFEKCLYLKGLEIFGKNSCLIARNLLGGMKTCAEVFRYVTFTESKLCHRAEGSNSAEGHSQGDHNDATGRTRSRFMRRKGKVRRLKYSAAYHAFRKRIIERKDLPCKQFNPCNCQSACGKQCTCHLGGTCCEKYCGCSKTCKNRFRGCHCAKSQCRSRQCPCFAAGRECDPDVCRNCWVGCGDGTLGGPPQRGDNYECRNMKLLLKQQQRVLLGRSDVSGWGAFIKNGVSKHEYLGEYTGELISHREADKRGKIYDRENSSFLFNLNDQFVLDAYRKGDKLKFANHSPDPNCYAKVMMVAGDHRVGIFANQKLNAGEELFYDYRYEPDRAPSWAKKPEIPGSKKVEIAPSSGRAKKRA